MLPTGRPFKGAARRRIDRMPPAQLKYLLIMISSNEKCSDIDQERPAELPVFRILDRRGLDLRAVFDLVDLVLGLVEGEDETAARGRKLASRA